METEREELRHQPRSKPTYVLVNVERFSKRIEEILRDEEFPKSDRKRIHFRLRSAIFKEGRRVLRGIREQGSTEKVKKGGT